MAKRKPAPKPKKRAREAVPPELMLHEGKQRVTLYRRDGKTISVLAQAKLPDASDLALFRRMAASAELLECAELLRSAIEFQIRRDRAQGDEEGANLKTNMLHVKVLPAIAKARGRSAA